VRKLGTGSMTIAAYELKGPLPAGPRKYQSLEPTGTVSPVAGFIAVSSLNGPQTVELPMAWWIGSPFSPDDGASVYKFFERNGRSG
jgi:hypothetical protein